MATSAKDFFYTVKDAVARLNEVHLLIMNDCEDWRPEIPRARRQLPNPTANAAIYRMECVEPALKALRAEERELTRTIGRALVIIWAVRQGLGDKYADVLEWRFIDCITWARIQDDYGVSRATGHNRANVAFDWADSLGMTRILAGDLEI